MIGMPDLDTYHSEGRVASIQHSLGGHLAGGSNIAVLTALGLLLQAIGAAGKEDFDDDDVDAWWPIKVLILTFILGAMAGSYMTWRIMSGRQTAVATAAAGSDQPTDDDGKEHYHADGLHLHLVDEQPAFQDQLRGLGRRLAWLTLK